MSLTFCPSIELDPHDSARGDTTLLCFPACLAANKCAKVGLGLFDSTIKTDWVPIVFVYINWAFVHAVAAAEHPQAERVQYLHT
jgi:hypothetical protein